MLDLLQVYRIGQPRDGIYAELEIESGEKMNAWIDNPIYKRLKKLDLKRRNVYIMPLGTIISTSTG